ncbi:MAG TPA: VOC family protein [Gammaproteobacteria bacterium]|nr:VOC family protein [Gammaproteobacteria bacterium]
MRTDEISGERAARMSRRAFAASIAAVAAAPRAFAQSASIQLLKLNCFEIGVSDVDRALRFYQGLFGMPVQARGSNRVCLRIGDGPQFMSVRQAGAGEKPAITHIGYSVEGFEVQRVLAALRRIGFAQIDPPSITSSGIAHPMSTWVRMRGRTPELYFSDARGLVVQLSGPGYCGGSGEAGDVCSAPEPAPQGLMKLNDLSHFTVFVNDGAAADRFYQETFKLSVQAHQGPTPVIGIGDSREFVMYAGPRRDKATPAVINHGCFNMRGFNVDRVLGALTKYGLAARGDRRTGPLMHYVSLRMPDRGGAKGGTPELYFTDPDGILLQLQDVSYCGGGGYLGEKCMPA